MPDPNAPTVRPAVISILLGITQTIGYGTLYYAYGVLAPYMAEETGLSLTAVYGFFSAALLAGGLVAPVAGRQLDRFNSARVMTVGSLLAAAALTAWAMVPGRIAFGLLVILVEMSSVLVLYEAAFVAAARLAPAQARRTITGITLIAGFASTIFWPLTTWLASFMDWRAIYLCFAALNLLICAPLHLWLSTRRAAPAAGAASPADSDRLQHGVLKGSRRRRIAFAVLIVAFAANAYVISAVHLHLIGLLGALGLASSAAMIGAVLGPAQVAGRVAEYAIGERIGVMSVAIFSAIALPAGLIVLMAGGGTIAAGATFAVVFGVGQGLSYIVRGVLPLQVFGTEGYGGRMGRINSARLVVSAAAPLVTAALFEALGVETALATITIAGVIGVVGLLALIPLVSAGRT